jgi:hypothetical protein
MKNGFLLVISCFLLSDISAQPFQRLHPAGFSEGRELLNPWTGGFNKPQFSQVDLNMDGIDDIYVFDNAADISMGFEGFRENGAKKYRFNASLCAGFPSITEYALLRDYDGDGVADLFCSHPSIAGVRVFKGKFVNQRLEFDQVLWGNQQGLAGDALWYYRKNTQVKVPQLYVASTDIPGIYDVDGDGDLDILTFDLAGFTLHYYENISVERGFGLDSLLFVQEETCWGGFYESGITPAVDLSPVKGECFSNLQPDDLPGTGSRNPRHAGSTVLALDANEDGLTDVILGDISFSQLVLLINGGSQDTAWIIDQDDRFPSAGFSLELNSFPAAFSVDVDDDGRQDILVSPNSGGQHEDMDNIWYYQNQNAQGNTTWQLNQRNFLQDESFDFGSGSYPVFFDYNGDGLLDMVVGLTNRYSGGLPYSSSIFLFENKGDPSNPAFELIDSNYLDMASLCDPFGLNLCAFMPHFADMDSDGDLDFICADGVGSLYYRENVAGPQGPADFGPVQLNWQGIVAGAEAVPYAADLDNDGLVDLLMGLRAGRIMFYKNIGTATMPVFNMDQSAPENIRVLGGINTRGPLCLAGSSNPSIVYEAGVKKIVSGSDCNGLKTYLINENDIRGSFLLESSHAIHEVNEGRYVKASFADLDGDGFLEMAAGNIRGGISFYSSPFRMDDSIVSSAQNVIVKNDQAKVFPNPVTDIIQIEFSSVSAVAESAEVFDLNGRLMLRSSQLRTMSSLDLRFLPVGIYSIRFHFSDRMETHRILKH